MERAKELLLNSALLMFAMFLAASALAIAPSTAWATEEADTVVYWGVEGDPYSLTLHLSPTPNSVCTQSENLDAIGWTSTPWYSYKDSVTSVVVDDDFSPSTCAYWFQDMKVLQYFDLDKLDTSKATSMAHMFRGCAGWIGGNIDETTHESLIWVGLDLSKFDTSSATDLSGMFATVTAWKSDFNSQMANWDVSHVENMSTMFLQAGIDIVLPDDYRYSCFCPDVSNWNTPALINASNMFAGCPSTSFTTIDLSNWTFDNVTDVSSMFSDDSSLTTIYAASDLDWSVNSKITSHAGAFSGCSSLAGSAGTVYDSAHSDKSYGRVDGGVDAPGYFSTRPPSSGEGIAVEDNLAFNHHLNASAAANMTGITYRVNITPHVLSGTPDTGVYEVPAAVTSAMSALTATSFAPATDTAAAGSTEWEKTFTSTKTFEQVFGPAFNFGHAGVYLFDVSETVAGGTSSDAAKWSWTSAAGNAAPEHYLVRIYVENGQSGLEYAYATISQLDSNGQELANDAGKVSTLDFSSQYTATQTLVISKEVEGSFGNQSYPFPFEVTLYLPEWVGGAPADNVQNEEPPFESSVDDLITTDVTELVFTSEEWAVPQAGDPSSKKVVGTANIADGQGVVLTVPVGTRYKVDEKSSVAGSSAVLDAAGIPYDVGMEWNVGTITQQVTKVDAQGGSFVVAPTPDAVVDGGVAAGATAYVVCTPDTGYGLASVSVIGTDSGTAIPVNVSGNTASFTMPAEGVTVTSTFVKSDYALSESAPPASHGSFFMARSASAMAAESTAQYGDDVFIISEPDTGYELAGATVTGDVSGNNIDTSLIGGDKAQFSMPAEPVSAGVEFEKIDYTILTPAATGSGTYIVDSNSIPASNIASAQYGDTVYVGVQSATGYEASVVVRGAVSGTDTGVALTNNIGSFSMPAENISVLVTFSKIDYTISTSAPSNGTFIVSKNTSGSPVVTSANYNDTVYVVATPAANYQVESMSVVEAGTNTPVTLTRPVGGNDNVGSFTMPANGVSVSVTFAKAHVNLYTMSELQAISADLRANGTNSTYYSTFNAFAGAGDNVTVTLHDGTTTKNATLVDASADYGLVFMLDKIANDQMNVGYSNSGGWADSFMRTNLRPEGELYDQYLDGMKMNLADATAQVVIPASVTTYSCDRNGGAPRQQTTTGDTFFLASITEIYGPTFSNQFNNNWTYGAKYEKSCHQFAYFKNLGVTGSKYSALSNANGFTKAAGLTWWLRSADASDDGSAYFWTVCGGGYALDGDANSSGGGVLPCFCL